LIRVLFLLLPGLAFAGVPDGQTIAMHGTANGALPCAACHGLSGRGNPSIGAPALAGLPAVAIEGFLGRFAAQGGGGVMTAVAKALTPDETRAVAEYFAGLPKT
jgi:cytochrome c553